MRPNLRRDFEYGKQLVKRLLVLAIAFCVGSLLTPNGSYGQIGLLLLSLLCMVGELGALWMYCRCPHCGKRIMLGALSATVCPRCHRNLATGKKTKKR